MSITNIQDQYPQKIYTNGQPINGEEVKQQTTTEETVEKSSEMLSDDKEAYDEVISQIENLASNITETASSSEESDGEMDVKEALAKIKELKSNISVYTSQLEILQQKISEKQAELNEKLALLDKLQDEYEELEQEKAEKEKEIQEYDESIKEVEEAIKAQMEIINNANSGSPEDLETAKAAQAKISSLYSEIETFSNKKLEVYSEISSLTTELSEKSSEISKQQISVDSLNNFVSGLQAQVSNISSLKSAAETELSNIKINLVSDEEMALVEANNIDLTEKLPDGNPKYIFAPGKSDGKYHIYDMSQNATLARLYGEGGGYDIVESGNGYISNYKLTDCNSGEECFYLDECGNYNNFNACYCTSSPLSLDTNGDGVKTSNKIINYDIDGDGKKDKINDSADAVLVFDKDGNGISGEDGSECFGDNTDLDGDGIKDCFSNGFEALKAFAEQNNLINGKDDNVLDEKDINFLEEKYGFKLKMNGYNSEAQSLSDAGITEINLANTDITSFTDNFDGKGNQLMQQEGATFKINGETREYADIWHKKFDESLDNALETFGGSSLSFNISAAASNFILKSALRRQEMTANSINNSSLNKLSIDEEINSKIDNLEEKAEKEKEKEKEKDK